jgi:hypothetical protein
VLFSAQLQHPLVENQRAALVLYHAPKEEPGDEETNAAFYYVKDAC